MLTVNNNDIVEIRIAVNNSVVEIGASSDCDVKGSRFFDKRFYVEKTEFTNSEDFKKAVELYSHDGKVNVVSIDGLSA